MKWSGVAGDDPALSKLSPASPASCTSPKGRLHPALWSGPGESNPSCWLGRPLRAITKAALIAILPALTACQSIPEAPKVVKIPVSVPCLSEIPPKPALVTDAELLAMPDAAFVLALAADRIERARWMGVAGALLSGCVK